jgi:uncharacterized membrane-anchored protein YitT (DUF2179 family)
MRLKETAKSLTFIILGSLLMAVSMRLFLVPNRIAPGGVSGLATVIYYVTGWHTGTLILLINLPLFIITLFTDGWKLFGKTLLSVVVMSLGTDYLPIPSITSDALLASLFGGFILGLGLGLVEYADGNSGGTALISHLVHKFVPHLSIAWILFGIDFVVVVLSAFVFEMNIALYALVSLYISSEVYDRVIIGFGSGKSIYIVSEKIDVIARRILSEVERGCTQITAHGMYSDEPRGMLLCIVKSSRELLAVKRIVVKEDQKAFVFVADAKEVTGEGFVRHGH